MLIEFLVHIQEKFITRVSFLSTIFSATNKINTVNDLTLLELDHNFLLDE